MVANIKTEEAWQTAQHTEVKCNSPRREWEWEHTMEFPLCLLGSNDMRSGAFLTPLIWPRGQQGQEYMALRYESVTEVAPEGKEDRDTQATNVKRLLFTCQKNCVYGGRDLD